MKSLEELEKLRDEEKFELGIREEIDHHNYTHIKVGMSTIGIEAGARDTMKAFLNGVGKEKMEKVAVYPVVYDSDKASAPVITVSMPDKSDVVYKQVTVAKAAEIFEKHILGGNIVSDYLL